MSIIDVMRNVNKFNQRESARRHYELNCAKIKRRAVAFTERAMARNRAFITEYLSAHACVDCGEQDREVLTFDHVTGKKRDNVSDMAKNASIATLIKEIAKCEVRCCNCHARVTRLRRSVACDAGAMREVETSHLSGFLFD